MARFGLTAAPHADGSFIMIVATVGGGSNGNIAIDDITLTYGACGESLTGVDVRQRALKTVHAYQKKKKTTMLGTYYCVLAYSIIGRTPMR